MTDKEKNQYQVYGGIDPGCGSSRTSTCHETREEAERARNIRNSDGGCSWKVREVTRAGFPVEHSEDRD